MFSCDVRDAEVIPHHSQTKSLDSDGQLIEALCTEERDERHMVCLYVDHSGMQKGVRRPR